MSKGRQISCFPLWVALYTHDHVMEEKLQKKSRINLYSKFEGNVDFMKPNAQSKSMSKNKKLIKEAKERLKFKVKQF